MEINGTNGADNISGTSGDDTIHTGNGTDTIDAGDGNDTIFSGSGKDTIYAGDGDDTVDGGKGNDIIDGGAGDDYIDGNDNNDTLSGGDGDDILIGNSGNDLLSGGAGNDFLKGDDGKDALRGGTGNDIYYIVDNEDDVTELADEGEDSIWATLNSYTLGVNVENLRFIGSGNFTGNGNELSNLMVGGASNDVLNGDAGDDFLFGGSGNDALDGEVGADALAGGDGDDSYVVDSEGDAVTENADEGQDKVTTTLGAYTLGANLEDLIFAGSGDFTGNGNGLDNSISGNAGNDTLDGGLGADTMIGLGGDDTYHVDDAGDTVVEDANAGNDTVKTSLTSYTLGNHLENLEYTGDGNFIGTGNALDNMITGSAGEIDLGGGPGSDPLAGGGGGAPPAGPGGGGGGGGGGGSGPTASAGHDTLDGGLGADTMIGLGGDDTYHVDDAGDTVVEDANAGNDTVKTSLTSYTLGNHVEDLRYIGTGGFTGNGNELNNIIAGGSGDDNLNGDSGNDTLIAGAGNNTLEGGVGADTYVLLDTALDNIILGDVDDTVRIVTAPGSLLTQLSFSLSDTQAAILQYIGDTDFTGIGNSNANDIITGGNGDDLLNGASGTYHEATNRAGVDQLFGGNGNDTLVAHGESGILNGGNGIDTITYQNYAFSQGGLTIDLSSGAAFNVSSPGSPFPLALRDDFTSIENAVGTAGGDTLLGDANANLLDGQDGDDVILGGAGNDELLGGNGNDSLDGGTGSNQLNGGDGIDWAVYANAFAGVVVDLTAGHTSGGGGIIDTLVAIENLRGSGYADNLSGDMNANIIDGGHGADMMTGGGGNDVFVLRAGEMSDFGGPVVEAITDFRTHIHGGEHDLLDLRSFGPGTSVQVESSGGWALVRIQGSLQDSILLLGVAAADFNSLDYILV